MVEQIVDSVYDDAVVDAGRGHVALQEDADGAGSPPVVYDGGAGDGLAFVIDPCGEPGSWGDSVGCVRGGLGRRR